MSSHVVTAKRQNRPLQIKLPSSMLPLGLENKVVLVTGSTEGVGRAIAEAFLEHGRARVLINGRKAERVQSVLEELQVTYGEQVGASVADVATDAGVQQLQDDVKTFSDGVLDVLVNNVGIYTSKDFFKFV